MVGKNEIPAASYILILPMPTMPTSENVHVHM
jgi:hypothetical protein